MGAQDACSLGGTWENEQCKCSNGFSGRHCLSKGNGSATSRQELLPASPSTTLHVTPVDASPSDAVSQSSYFTWIWLPVIFGFILVAMLWKCRRLLLKKRTDDEDEDQLEHAKNQNVYGKGNGS